MAVGDTPSGCSAVGGFGRIVDLSVLVRPLDVAGVGMGSRVELYAAIRFDWQRNQMSVRALAEKYSVHRRTVREAIASPVPPPRKSPPRRTLVLDSVRDVVDAMLVEDLTAPRKQRHTARRIFERLGAGHDPQVSFSYVAKYVHRRPDFRRSQAHEGLITGCDDVVVHDDGPSHGPATA